MSDYTVTHGHLLEERDRAQAEVDLTDWLDSLPQDFAPQCGQCNHFKFRDLVGDDGGGWCQLRTVPSYGDGADTKEDRHMSDDACPKFLMGIPF